MGVLSAVGRGFDNVMDWATEGSLPWSLTKFTGLVLGATALVCSPFVYIAHQNAQALEHRIEYLDSTATHVFNSVAQCAELGYTIDECTASQDEAISIASELGTTLKYNSAATCASIHETCQQVITPITTYTKVGDVMVPNTVYVTNYHPPVVAWQAAANNLDEAVPLYKTPNENVAVRYDGAQFNF